MCGESDERLQRVCERRRVHVMATLHLGRGLELHAAVRVAFEQTEFTPIPREVRDPAKAWRVRGRPGEQTLHVGRLGHVACCGLNARPAALQQRPLRLLERGRHAARPRQQHEPCRSELHHCACHQEPQPTQAASEQLHTVLSQRMCQSERRAFRRACEDYTIT